MQYRGLNHGNLATTEFTGTNRILIVNFQDKENGFGDDSSRHFTNTNGANSRTFVKGDQAAGEQGGLGQKDLQRLCKVAWQVMLRHDIGRQKPT